MTSNWCETCEETCQDHPTVCTICGDTLRSPPASSSSQRLEEAVTFASATNNNVGGIPANLGIPTNISEIMQQVRQTTTTTTAVGGDMWETPPPEALDPNNATHNNKSRPTSKECIQRLPRLTIKPNSAVLHDVMIQIVLPPSINKEDRTMKRPAPISYNAMVAEFGPVPPYSIKSSIALANPITGAASSTSHDTTAKHSVLYMERGGGLTFAAKALNAQQHYNAKALIIGNNVSVWPYIMRDSKNESNASSIPIVMIKRSDGNSLRRLLETHKQSKSTLHCSITATKCNSNGGGGECVVCRDNFDIGDVVIRLPFCSHVFHESCALMWLRNHNTCPYCRRELPTEDEGYEMERRRNHGRQGEDLNSNPWDTLFG
uniref:RING-type domain-containing protein n=1 Tax=Ditylum brightwellii TaxID=49249 RepID=A0A7S4SBJ1_9STRA